jgi:hypothetical protein
MLIAREKVRTSLLSSASIAKHLCHTRQKGGAQRSVTQGHQTKRENYGMSYGKAQLKAFASAAERLQQTKTQGKAKGFVLINVGAKQAQR